MATTEFVEEKERRENLTFKQAEMEKEMLEAQDRRNRRIIAKDRVEFLRFSFEEMKLAKHRVDSERAATLLSRAQILSDERKRSMVAYQNLLQRNNTQSPNPKVTETSSAVKSAADRLEEDVTRIIEGMRKRHVLEEERRQPYTSVSGAVATVMIARLSEPPHSSSSPRKRLHTRKGFLSSFLRGGEDDIVSLFGDLMTEEAHCRRLLVEEHVCMSIVLLDF